MCIKNSWLLIVLMVLTGCGGEKKKEPSAEMLKSPMYKARQEIKPALDYYLEMKDALIEDDAAKAGEAAELMLLRLEHSDLMGIRSLNIVNLVNLRAETRIAKRQVGLDSLRASFARISAAMVSLLLETGAPEVTLYVQSCPIANKNFGAQWVSKADEVVNPYLGEKMLGCGAVDGMIGTREY